MDNLQGLVSSPTELAVIAIVPLTTIYYWYRASAQKGAQNDEAPYLVSASWPLSLIGHARSVFWNNNLTQKGYEQYRDGMFKMPFFGQWITVASSRYIEEIIHAPESSLSFRQNLNDQLQLELLVGPAISKDQIHLTLIRILNRNLDEIYPELCEEVPFAVTEEVGKGKENDGWISVPAYKTVNGIVATLNHRAFVGLPECRDTQWKAAMAKDAQSVALRTWLLRLFPESKKPTMNSFLNRFSKPFDASVGIVSRIINERLNLPEEERSNDLLSWIITRMPEHDPDARLICGIFQLITSVAQETTAMTFAHALFHLVAHPECIEILREEIVETIDGGEITRESLDEMHKLDSFLRETQRMSTIGNFTLGRTALHDFTFSNGVRVPAGELIQVAAAPMHMDAAYYPDPLEFKPWRYSEQAQKEANDGASKEATKKAPGEYDMVVPTATNLSWGLGRHACPGRWYAVMIMKHLMAYLILNYDMKLPESAKGKRPVDLCFASVRIPNTTATILFKSRKQ